MILPSHSEPSPLFIPSTFNLLPPPSLILPLVQGSSENEHFFSKHKQSVLDPHHPNLSDNTPEL